MIIGARWVAVWWVLLAIGRHAAARQYSLSSINIRKAIKTLVFCEQTLHKGLIDAACDWLQLMPKNRGQNKFLRKLRAKIQFSRLLFSSSRKILRPNF
jgi:hypothetical protein